MNTVKLKGIVGEFKIHQENGVFVTLLAVVPTKIYKGDGIYHVLHIPQKIGFKEWEAMGGSLSGNSKVKYSYGYLSCHKNQLDII